MGRGSEKNPSLLLFQKKERECVIILVTKECWSFCLYFFQLYKYDILVLSSSATKKLEREKYVFVLLCVCVR